MTKNSPSVNPTWVGGTKKSPLRSDRGGRKVWCHIYKYPFSL